ncbi:hypothetical protein PVAP13_2KG497410 [Panicum virgatum]|uniref:Uncharacterized protein n=1 Tax=Panicum virgatum TaxID=38727 RepID=A0A8T0WSR7_PANVG|nr:hypothetical protein PVAP13_2KG497410 [Panicum virgatum]
MPETAPLPLCRGYSIPRECSNGSPSFFPPRPVRSFLSPYVGGSRRPWTHRPLVAAVLARRERKRERGRRRRSCWFCEAGGRERGARGGGG